MSRLFQASAFALIILVSVYPTLVLATDSPRTETDSTQSTASTCMQVAVTPSQTGPVVIRCAFIPIDDGFVESLTPNIGPGSRYVLIVQDTPSIPRSENYAYLKFDLRSLPKEIVASGAKPVNATLWMYVRYLAPFYNASISVRRVTSDDWNGSSLTWSNKPAFDQDSNSVASIADNGTWVRWDIIRHVSLELKESNQISLALVATDTAWRNLVWFDSKDHPLNGNVSTRPELDLDFVEPILTVETSYPNTPLTIESQTFETAANGRFQAYVPWGSYTISVSEIVPRGEGARTVFTGWSDNDNEASRPVTIGNNLTLRANYEIQYYLNVTSPYAVVNGSGWHTEGPQALVSLQPSTIMAEGLSGLLGVRRIFDHWNGDCIGTQPECSVTMNGPKNVTAVWRDDYTITIIWLVALIVAATALALLRRRNRPRS